MDQGHRQFYHQALYTEKQQLRSRLKGHYIGSALGQRLTHLTTPEKSSGSRLLGAVHFKVLALPNRITSRICAPLFGARARLTLLHWSAAMRLPLALLVLLSLRSPPHSIGAAKSPRRLLHAPLLPQWCARWTVSRRLQRPPFL